MDDGGQAFPGWHLEGQYQATKWCNGMTLRDWFAGKALAGLDVYHWNKEVLSKRSYEIADAMLKQRNNLTNS